MTETIEEIKGDISISPPLVIDWMVDYFSFTKGMVRRFKSPAFRFLDGMWYLQSWQDINNISLYLFKEKTVISRYCIPCQLGIRRADGTVYHSFFEREQIYTANEGSSGAATYLHKFRLTKDKWLIAPQGLVNFFCILGSKGTTNTASQTIRFEGISVSTQTLEEDLRTQDLLDLEELLSIPTGTDKLAQDLKDLMLNEQDCDITIKINGRNIRAHRFILGARSPVFLSMFTHDTVERKTGIVIIEDCDPDIFYTFLMFLYTGEVQEFTPNNVCELYGVAEKYSVLELKLKCIKYMVMCLSIDNFCDIMCLALKYKENSLIKAATDFFVKNVKKINITMQWQYLIKKYPLECNELYINFIGSLDSSIK